MGEVPEGVARHLFDDKFGQGSFAALSERLRAIYKRPFFLDLAIRAGKASDLASQGSSGSRRLWAETRLHEG